MNTFTLELLLAAIFAPAVIGGATLLLPRSAVTSRVLLALGGLLTSVTALLLVGVQPDAAPTLSFVPSMHLDLVFNPDRLGIFFALLVAGIGALIVLYARGYFGRDEDSLYRFYPTLGLFATAMLGIVLSDNMLGMFLFWELTSVSSFLLIGWERENRKALLLAIQAFIVTGAGGLSLLGGVLLMGFATDAWTFRELLEVFTHGHVESPGLVAWACLMIFLGCATKSAQWPFHFWLPGAMAAPTPVSAYLHSATMVKAGVYLIARLFPIFGAWLVYWGPTLVIFGAITMLLGGYLAVRSAGLKKIFAYTTVSQLGLLVCMYGLGAFHAEGGGGHGHGEAGGLIFPVTQILNHALYKAPLFIIAGAIIHVVGRSELPQLRGLWKTHRTLALVALAAGYALAGGPLTLSFAMKEAFFYQVKHAAEAEVWIWLVGAMGVATAVCNVTILVRMARTFFAAPGEAHGAEAHGHHDDGHAHGHEHGFWGACIWWPAAALVAWQFIGGLAPGLFEHIIAPVETSTGSWGHLSHGSLWYALAHPGIPLLMSLIAMGAGVAVGFTSLLAKPQADPHDALFPAYFRGMQLFGHSVFSRFQTGSLRQYFLFVLGALALCIAAAAIMEPGMLTFPELVPFGSALLGLKLAGFLLTGLICATSLMMPFTERRIVRVLMLSACGFSVTGMYLLYQAPDLALTQLMCEIIGVVLFLLVLRLLPEERAREERREVPKLPRAVMASIVGVSIGWIVLQAGSVADHRNVELARQQASTPEHVEVLAAASGEGAPLHGEHVEASDYPSLGGWFIDHAYDGTSMTEGRGGGGSNIVNVILVDFRGYDTLGEITVLAVTVMGVLSLLSSVPPTRIRGVDPTVCYVGAQPQLRSVLLHTAMRLILPLSLIFAAYIFFKGHNQPGGGFIAGLIASVGLAVYRMTEGFDALKRIVPIRPGHLAATGLFLALGTGVVVPLALMLTGVEDEAAFLRSWHGHIPLFGGGDYHFTSVAFFDLGVFLCVVGASVGIINRLEEELE